MPSVALNYLDRTLTIQNLFLFLPSFPNHLFLIPSHKTKLGFSIFIIGISRVNKVRSRDRGGSGLGLAIAKAIALAHQGNINVKSELGKGSNFTICLPIM